MIWRQGGREHHCNLLRCPTATFSPPPPPPPPPPPSHTPRPQSPNPHPHSIVHYLGLGLCIIYYARLMYYQQNKEAIEMAEQMRLEEEEYAVSFV